MMRKRLILYLFLCLALTVQAQQDWRNRVTQRLDSLMQDELLESAQIGMMVWDLNDDAVVYQHKPRYLMRTASTMKAVSFPNFSAISAREWLVSSTTSWSSPAKTVDWSCLRSARILATS